MNYTTNGTIRLHALAVCDARAVTRFHLSAMDEEGKLTDFNRLSSLSDKRITAVYLKLLWQNFPQRYSAASSEKQFFRVYRKR